MGAGMQRRPGDSAQNVWFLGSSQLILSVIPAFCSPETLQLCEADWHARRFTKGELDLGGGRTANFVSCSMATLGDPAYVSDQWHPTPGLVEYMDTIDGDAQVIVSMLRGNEFVLNSLVDTPPRWDFSYGQRQADPSRVFVQQVDIAAHVDDVLGGLFATLAVIRQRFPQAAVYHVAPPPPVEHGSPHLEPAKLRADGMGEIVDLVESYGVRPFPVRQKIYDAMYERLAAKLPQVGVEFLFAPAACLTSEGATRSDFATDCLHGNDLYGRAIVRDFEERHLSAPV